MSQDLDIMIYMIAAEKMGNLIYTLEATMDFVEEYEIKPDEEVKKCLKPLLEQMKQWISILD